MWVSLMQYSDNYYLKIRAPEDQYLQPNLIIITELHRGSGFYKDQRYDLPDSPPAACSLFNFYYCCADDISKEY